MHPIELWLQAENERRRQRRHPLPPLTIRQFALQIGVQPGTLRKILQGHGCQTPTAVAIIEGTRGRVKLRDLLPHGENA